MERRATRSVNGELNIRIGIPAPVLKRGVRARQLRTPDLITVVGVFRGPNGPRMAPHLNENGIEPALGLRVLEEVIGDPEHQPLPFCVAALASCAGALSPASKYPGQRRSSSRTTSAGGSDPRSSACRAQYARASQSM